MISSAKLFIPNIMKVKPDAIKVTLYRFECEKRFRLAGGSSLRCSIKGFPLLSCYYMYRK